jgi:hypothetical protein
MNITFPRPTGEWPSADGAVRSPMGPAEIMRLANDNWRKPLSGWTPNHGSTA